MFEALDIPGRGTIAREFAAGKGSEVVDKTDVIAPDHFDGDFRDVERHQRGNRFAMTGDLDEFALMSVSTRPESSAQASLRLIADIARSREYLPIIVLPVAAPALHYSP